MKGSRKKLGGPVRVNRNPSAGKGFGGTVKRTNRIVRKPEPQRGEKKPNAPTGRQRTAQYSTKRVLEGPSVPIDGGLAKPKRKSNGDFSGNSVVANAQRSSYTPSAKTKEAWRDLTAQVKSNGWTIETIERPGQFKTQRAAAEEVGNFVQAIQRRVGVEHMDSRADLKAHNTHYGQRKAGHLLLVRDQDGKPIITAQARALSGTRDIYGSRFYSSPEIDGTTASKGVSRRMFSYLEQWGREIGAEGSVFKTYNSRTIPLYKRRGYEVTGTTKEKGETVHWFRKDIRDK